MSDLHDEPGVSTPSGPGPGNAPPSGETPLLERCISCEGVPRGRRLKVFHEAADRALKSLACQFPEAEGCSVKLRHMNLPSFAPAYYIGTLDRIEVRHGWTFGLNVLLDATGKRLAGFLG